VAGEAAEAYRATADDTPRLDRYARTILFLKPELVIVFDRLEAPKPATYQYWLHAANAMEVGQGGRVQVQAGDVLCDIKFLTPEGLTFRQTDQYDPNPRERVKLREWHLTASTPEATEKTAFVTLYRPHRKDQAVPREAELKAVPGGYVLSARLNDGSIRAVLPTSDKVLVQAEGLQARDWAVVERLSADDQTMQTVRLAEHGVE
jgi:hypothetical protein